MIEVSGPPYIWIALSYGAMGRLIQSAKGDVLAGAELIRVDRFSFPDDLGAYPEGSPRPMELGGVGGEDEGWEFHRTGADGGEDTFEVFEIFYLFYPLLPQWTQYFSEAPFVAIPYPPFELNG